MASFSFHNGRVISHADITVIYARRQNVPPDLPKWIDSTNGLPEKEVCLYNSFIYDLIDSTYIDLLGQTYSAPGHTFGRGTFNTSIFLDLPYKDDGSALFIDY